jgi:glycosyltransferase involved in cell wall biosynthesis
MIDKQLPINNPLVSIIIPTFNRAHLIGETLDSVLSQTYTNWECIVVDDGSTDETEKLLATYCAKDNRFRYHHRPSNRPKGANACRNYGFESSKGEYIQFLDSDDLISINKIEGQIVAMNNEQSNDIATCSWGYFRKKIRDSVIQENEPYYLSYQKGLDLLNVLGSNSEYFPSHVYLTKRNVINIAGGWDELLAVNQDGEYFCRVLLNCVNVVFVKNAVVYYRTTPEITTSTSNTQEKMAQRIESWKIINSHILKKYKINNSKYVRNAKENLFVVVSKKHPELIKMNRSFFYYQILKNLIMNNRIIAIAKKIIK